MSTITETLPYTCAGCKGQHNNPDESERDWWCGDCGILRPGQAQPGRVPWTFTFQEALRVLKSCNSTTGIKRKDWVDRYLIKETTVNVDGVAMISVRLITWDADVTCANWAYLPEKEDRETADWDKVSTYDGYILH